MDTARTRRPMGSHAPDRELLTLGATFLAATYVVLGAGFRNDVSVSLATVAISIGGVSLVLIWVGTIWQYRDAHGLPWRRLAWETGAVVLLLGVAVARNGHGNHRPFPGIRQTTRATNRLLGGPVTSGTGDNHLITLLLTLALIVVVVFLAVSMGLLSSLRRLGAWFAHGGWIRGADPTVAADGLDTPLAGVSDANERALEMVLAESRWHLADGGDPRRSVIAAYIALENRLIADGHPRAVADTAGEYVDRALTEGLRAEPRHVRDLLSIFNRARFSPEEITRSDAEAAVGHLNALEAKR
ncbi:MAG: DUF4129 domain-containing protein [Nocardioidaceae bacterium]